MILKGKHRIKFGSKGEKIALQFLKSKSYKIIETNFRCPMGEIDIIAKDEDTLVLIEVRSRKDTLIDPIDTVTSKKQNKLRQLAVYYSEIHAPDTDLRLDVIGITVKNEKTLIEHIENAFNLI